MDTRRVQVTGGSTYTVSIPKEWAKDAGVSGGDRLELHPVDDVLFLLPAANKGSAACTIDGRQTSEDDCIRMITTMYINGFDHITVQYDGTSDDVPLSDVPRRLLGMEIDDVSATEVRFSCIFDDEEFSVETALSRMQRLSVRLLDDATTALTEANDDLARTVVRGDDEVDRFWLALERLNRRMLRSPELISRYEVSAEELYDAYIAARQFERIADHACKIAGLTLDGCRLPDATEGTVAELGAMSVSVVKHANAAMMADDVDKTRHHEHAVYSTIGAIEDATLEAIARSDSAGPDTRTEVRIAIDSLSRCADYGRNIVDMTLEANSLSH